MEKIIADALREEVTKYGIMSMTRRSSVIDYDRLSKAVVNKLEELGYF